jgi:hypothetical protein
MSVNAERCEPQREISSEDKDGQDQYIMRFTDE